MMNEIKSSDKKIYDLKFKTNESRKRFEMLELMFQISEDKTFDQLKF